MGPSAKVTSIDAIQAFAAALERFQEEVSNALEELGLQVRRAKEWVQDDRKRYWDRQVRRGWEKVTEAKVQLEGAKTFRRIADYRPSCIDEKKAHEAAKRRLRLAEEKVEAVRHWSRAVEHAVSEYRGETGPLAAWLEVDAPQAVATLRRLTDALDTYVAISSLPESTAAASLPQGEGGRNAPENVLPSGSEEPDKNLSGERVPGNAGENTGENTGEHTGENVEEPSR